MNNQEQIQRLEADIVSAKKTVEFGDALQRLRSNRDFKTVIQSGYLEQEAIRLVHLKGDPAMQSPEAQAAIVRQIDSIGELSNYFRTVDYQTRMGIRAIAADSETLEELLAEEGNNNG